MGVCKMQASQPWITLKTHLKNIQNSNMENINLKLTIVNKS